MRTGKVNNSKFGFVYDMTPEEASRKHKKYRNYPKKYTWMQSSKYKSSHNNFMSYLTSLAIRAKLRDR